MTKTDLKAMRVEQLRELAGSWGVELPESAKKQDIIDILLAEQENRENDGNAMEFGNMEMGEEQQSGSEEKSIDEIMAEASVEVEDEGQTDNRLEDVVENSEQVDDGIEDHSSVPVEMVSMADITPTKMNFFKPLSPAKYDELKASIADNGLLVPIIIRSNANGVESDKKYEILAGENRYRVFLDLGKTEIPARIMEVSDEKAKEILIDTNVAQRGELSPMEVARAYKEKWDLIGNRQGKRSDLTGEEAGTTRDRIAKEYKVSGMTVDRYLRLMNLLPEFQEMVDNGEIPAKTGMELGLLDEDTQNKILEVSDINEEVLSTKNVSKVKTLVNEKKKEELEKEENKGKKKGEIKVKVESSEIEKLLEETVKPMKFTVTVPDDTDEETKDFIEGNLMGDHQFLINLIADYVHGKLVPKKG